MSKNLQIILQEKFKEYKSSNNIDEGNTGSKIIGNFFENFCCEIFLNYYGISLEDVEVDDFIFRTNDGHLDIIISPLESGSEWTIIQTYATSLGKKSKKIDSISRDKYDSFYGRADNDKILNQDWIEGTFKDLEHKNKIIDLKKAILNGEKVRWIYVTNCKKTEKEDNCLNTLKCKNFYNVEFELKDDDELYRLYKWDDSKDESPPDIKIEHADQKVIFQQKNKSKNQLGYIFCIIKGTTLNELYEQNKESLFTYNIRNPLGDKGKINKQIQITLENEPENFKYYNNGISAVCSSLNYDPETKMIVAKKFNVINGAQTVKSIYDARNFENVENKEIEVLLKITELKDNQIVRDNIVKFNNTQNKLENEDFRSNDKIQKDLRIKISEIAKSYKGLDIENISYEHKKPYKKSTKAKPIINIKDFARIRCSYKKGDSKLKKSPVKMWDNSKDGFYNDIFNEILVDSKKELKEFFLMWDQYKLSGNWHKKKKEELFNDDEKIKYMTTSRFKTTRVNVFYKFYIKEIKENNNEEEILSLKGKIYDEFVDLFDRSWDFAFNTIYKEYVDKQSKPAYSLTSRDSLVDEIIDKVDEAKKLLKER